MKQSTLHEPASMFSYKHINPEISFFACSYIKKIIWKLLYSCHMYAQQIAKLNITLMLYGRNDILQISIKVVLYGNAWIAKSKFQDNSRPLLFLNNFLYNSALQLWFKLIHKNRGYHNLIHHEYCLV